MFEVRLDRFASLQNSNSKADVEIAGAYVRVDWLSPRSLHNIQFSDIGLRGINTLIVQKLLPISHCLSLKVTI